MSERNPKEGQIKNGPMLGDLLSNNQRWASSIKQRDPALRTLSHPAAAQVSLDWLL